MFTRPILPDSLENLQISEDMQPVWYEIIRRSKEKHGNSKLIQQTI
jgi:hypothetical protein